MGHGVADMAHSLNDGAAMQRVLCLLDIGKLASWLRKELFIEADTDLIVLAEAMRRAPKKRPAGVGPNFNAEVSQIALLVVFETLVIPIWDQYYKLIASMSVLPGHPRKLTFPAFTKLCADNRAACHKGIQFFFPFLESFGLWFFVVFCCILFPL